MEEGLSKATKCLQEFLNCRYEREWESIPMNYGFAVNSIVKFSSWASAIEHWGL